MRYILSRASRKILSAASGERILCAFDFDGTLSPIVAHPERARLRERTRKLLAQLAAVYPCLIVSGRSRADLIPRLNGSGVRQIVGNHGAETASIVTKTHRDVRRWKRSLEPICAKLPGVWIEDKGLSLALHVRQAPDKRNTLRCIREAIAQLKNVCVFGGKHIINLVPGDAHDKGDAVLNERKRLKCDCVLFVGDDDNDEPAFALAGNIIAIRIGRKKNSHASYFLREQKEIDNLLSYLVQLRPAR